MADMTATPMAPATQQRNGTAVAPQLTVHLQELLSNLFLVLTEKESTVIKRRFALQGSQKQTLEKIGKHFNVTRERIRQIESIALGKLRRTVRTTRLEDVNELAKNILRLHGGLMREDSLISRVLQHIQGSSDLDGAVLRLSFSIDREMVAGKRTNTYALFWRLDSLSMDDVTVIMNNIVKILKKRKSCMGTDEVVSAIQSLNLFEGRVPGAELITSCLTIDDRLREIPEGWGLSEWRFVRPRSIRDKVEIILKKVGEPLHFMEIANRIRESQFDHKNVTV
jgi:hypothetical protein